MRTTTPALYIYLDSREVCRDTPDGKMLYIMRRYIAWIQQKHLCAICRRYIPFIMATTDHIEPRRMGGGFRDDRQSKIQATCWKCNSEKASRRY